MSSDSFERNELQEIRELLNSVVTRIGRLERHVGLNVAPSIVPARQRESDLDDDIVLAEVVHRAPPAAQPDIILSDDQDVSPPVAAVTALESSEMSAATTESIVPDKKFEPVPATPSESLESLIGGRLFTWVGGILLILATAFFVVWSWQNLNIQPWARVAMMHALALGIITAGTWFKDRMLELHSHVLYGVGIFGLYASALAMTHLYELGGEHRELLGFLDGMLITALAIGLSLRNKAVGIIILGAVGGYLTPLLTLQDSDPVVTFVYLAMLNIALLVSGHVGKWEFLKPTSWIVTGLYFAAAIFFERMDEEFRFFDSARQGTWLLALHATIYVLGTTIPHLLSKSRSNSTGNFILAGSSLGFLIGYALMNPQPVENIAITCFVLTAMHSVICWFAFTRLAVTDRLGRVSLALGSLFLTLGLTIWFHESPQVWTTIWALEGAAFGLIGFAFRDRQMLVTSTAAFALTLLRTTTLDFAPGFDESMIGVWDPRTLRWLFLTAAVGMTGSGYWWMPRVAPAAVGRSWLGQVKLRWFAGGFLAVANLLFLTAMFFQFRDNLPILLTICAVDVGLLWAIAFAKNQAEVRSYTATLAVGLSIFAFGLLAWQFTALTEHWSGWSRVAFLTTSVVFLTAGWNYWTARNRFSDQAEKRVHGLLTTAGHALLLGFLTAEVHLLFSDVNSYSPRTAITICSGVWSLYAAAVIGIGYRTTYPVMRILGLVLLSATALLTFGQYADKFNDGISNHWDVWSRASYLTCTGLMIGIGLAYWLKRKTVVGEFEKSAHGVLTIAGHVLMLAFLTAEISVFFPPGKQTTPELATYSVVWGAYAALLVGSGFLLRYPLARFLGIGLFAIVLIKVFMVDLAQVELIIRVIALVILGLLLLGVSSLYQKYKTRIEAVG